jgi:phytoene desaturase
MARTIGIIGSGIGALAAGIRLLSKGFQVTIFESRSIAGGKAAGVEVEGYRLDSGPTILRMPHLFSDLFSTAGLELSEAVPARMLSPHYRVYESPGTYLDILANTAQQIENISRFSSTDANKFGDFLQRTETIYQENLTPPPIEKENHRLRFNLRPKEVLPMQPSVFQETARFFQNSFIQQAFSFHPLLFGRNPFTTHHRNLMLFAIEQQWGIMHIEGGFHQVITKLVHRFQEMGGQLALNTQVERIIIEKRKAQILRLKSGKQLQFDSITSNLSPFQTQRLFQLQNEPVTTSPRQSTSYFMLHILFESNDEALQSNTILTTKNYGRYAQQVFNQNQLPDDPWLYLYAQSTIQNDLHPLMVITPVPNLGTSVDWRNLTFNFRNRVVEKIGKFIPNFNDRIHFERISTPFTIQEEFNLPGGSALFPPIRRGINNLYYVGDNTWTGLGLIAALSSAEQVTKTIFNENTSMV